MILTATPYRVSLFGGGTDYPEWYKDNGGFVVGLAINKYAYIGVNWAPPGQHHRYRVTYSKIEESDALDSISHPGARGVLQYFEIDKPITVSYMGDLPARGGLGASSSYVVGLVRAVRELIGRPLSFPASLAEEATRIEREVIKEAVGKQDQLFAAHGGLRAFKFWKNGTIVPYSPQLSSELNFELVRSMVLVHTGTARYAHEMAAKVIAAVPKNHAYLREMDSLAHEAMVALENSDLEGIANLLRTTWSLKKELHPDISNPDIDNLYSLGIRCGALGGKLLGAGGGGFLLFLVPMERRLAFEQNIGAPCVGVGVSEQGCQIVVNAPYNVLGRR